MTCSNPQIKFVSTFQPSTLIILRKPTRIFFKIPNLQHKKYFSLSSKQPNWFRKLLKFETEGTSIYYLTGFDFSNIFF